jgi:hypothetical protein
MAVLVIATLMFEGCSLNPQHKVITLISGGYGYEVGDIVLIATQTEPELGDIVQYDWELNKSSCMAFGPSVYLAKIIGRPGNKVSFNVPRRTIWGTTRYDAAANMELKVPENEYLADKMVGYECPPGEYDEHGSSISYQRFTIKREAIKGVILKKVGHDKEFEEQQKNRVY